MINKKQFNIKNTKKVLHKVGKQWIVVSAVLLGLVAGGSILTNAGASSISNHPVTEVGVNQQKQLNVQSNTKTVTGTRTTTNNNSQQTKNRNKKPMTYAQRVANHNRRIANDKLRQEGKTLTDIAHRNKAIADNVHQQYMNNRAVNSCSRI